jgi:hypothetical protein
MFSWLTKSRSASSIDGHTQMVIDDDNRKLRARRNYVRAEEARAMNQPEPNMFTRPMNIIVR